MYFNSLLRECKRQTYSMKIMPNMPLTDGEILISRSHGNIWSVGEITDFI